MNSGQRFEIRVNKNGKAAGISRRQFVFGGSLLPLPRLIGTISPLVLFRPSSSYRDFESSDIPDLRPLGTEPAKADEIAMADKLLLASPYKASPIDVMHYLESLKDRNSEGELYNGGWQRRWNPLIVRFFSETRTKPAGDTTAWCAATLNWVLSWCKYRGTQNASSGSFRNASSIIGVPHLGDIVVFARTDPDEARVGHGHVGLFLEHTQDAVHVLGGNQQNAYGHHSICRRWIKKRGKLLTFHSFHAIAAFK
jgi:uncharacterized protein (TIGR02594 family)